LGKEKANLEKLILEEGKSYEPIVKIYNCSESIRLGMVIDDITIDIGAYSGN